MLPEDFWEDFPAAYTLLLEEAGLSKAELHRRITNLGGKISAGRLSEWESLSRRPNLDSLFWLLAGLGKTLTDLDRALCQVRNARSPA